MIAADRGVDRALALGLHVDVAIGDFDSVSAAGLAAVEAAGALVERHPAAKDATDLELALDAAIALEPSRIVVVGSGRRPARPPARIDSAAGSCPLCGGNGRRVSRRQPAVGDPRLADADRRAGRVVSLLPVHGPAEGVTTSGLEYPLHDETLPAGTSRGVSNVFAATEAQITVARGCLIAVQPGPEREESL